MPHFPHLHEHSRQFNLDLEYERTINKDIEDNIIEYNLQPGDHIYLPLGWIHQLISTTPSLSITISKMTDTCIYSDLNDAQKILTIFKNIDYFIDHYYSYDTMVQWHTHWSSPDLLFHTEYAPRLD